MTCIISQAEADAERRRTAEWRLTNADAIEHMAVALADEQGLHLHLLNPDSRAFIMALATRAVAEQSGHRPLGELDLLDDLEERIETATRDLQRVLDRLPLPADKLANALEDVLRTLAADNS